LIQIQKLKLVSPLQMEHILDRCLMMGMELVTLEDVKSVTTQILLGKETGFSDTDALYYPGNDKIH